METYAVLVAESQLKGETDELDAVFEGGWPDRKKAKKPSIGQHTAQVVQQPAVPRPVQKSMFD